MAYVDRLVCTTRRRCRRRRCRRHRHRRPRRLVWQINKQQCDCYYRRDDIQNHCIWS